VAASEPAKSIDSWATFAVLALLLFYFWLDDKWPTKLRYSVQYRVRVSQVTVAKQPHNCDWLAAPLGSKNCHYDAVVQVVQIVSAKTGQRGVLQDDGKTVAWDNGNKPPAGTAAELHRELYVTWQEIED
jgi:hypothetical protein